MRKGDVVYMAWFPSASDMLFIDGDITDTNGPGGAWNISLKMSNVGYEGGAVFNAGGNLVAMVGPMPEFMSSLPALQTVFAVPITYASSLLSDAGIVIPKSEAQSR